MSEFVRGNLKFDKRWDGEKHGARRVMHVYDCFEPPAGTVYDFNPPTVIPVEIVPDFLQASEAARIVEGARLPTDANPTFDGIFSETAQGLSIGPWTIDLSGLPAAWQVVVPCFKVEVGYQILYRVYEVNVTTTARVTLAGEVYPAGDRIASFRALVPEGVHFYRSFEWNPKCCGSAPPGFVAPGTSHTDWEFRIRFSFTLPDGYKWNYQFKFGLDYWHDFREPFGPSAEEDKPIVPPPPFQPGGGTPPGGSSPPGGSGQ